MKADKNPGDTRSLPRLPKTDRPRNTAYKRVEYTQEERLAAQREIDRGDTLAELRKAWAPEVEPPIVAPKLIIARRADGGDVDMKKVSAFLKSKKTVRLYRRRRT